MSNATQTPEEYWMKSATPPRTAVARRCSHCERMFIAPADRDTPRCPECEKWLNDACVAAYERRPMSGNLARYYNEDAE